MKFLFGLFGIANPATWMIYAVQGVAIVALAVAGYQLIDSNWETDAGIKRGEANIQAKFDAFVLKVKVNGEMAEATARAKVADDKRNKDRSDENLKTARAAAAVANAGWLSLAKSRAGATGGYMPAPGPAAAGVDGIEIIRAKYERALGYIDVEGAKLSARGDAARVDLDAAKTWGAGRSAGTPLVVTDPPPP